MDEDARRGTFDHVVGRLMEEINSLPDDVENRARVWLLIETHVTRLRELYPATPTD
jgi:hypothetical protein